MGVVYHGEDGVPVPHLRGAVVRVGLVLTLKLLKQRVIVCTWKTVGHGSMNMYIHDKQS